MNPISKEMQYTASVSPQHLKTLGQYFTDSTVAQFMCSWACSNAKNMLDPAVGNSIFLSYAQKLNRECSLTGYEVDPEILNFFGNPTGAQLRNQDYLLNDWQTHYDAIVCNPPYNRFQAVPNREKILDTIYSHTEIRYSPYTNLYILFLIKSIFQLSETGKLAYLIPSEFLNSEYGTPIKQLMLDQKLLSAIVHFENDRELFRNAATTCCILLLDHEKKSHVRFYSVKSTEELKDEKFWEHSQNCLQISYKDLNAGKKWRSYLSKEEETAYCHLRPVSDFCTVCRGIATGANDFFCFSKEKAEKYQIPSDCLQKCICRSADIKLPILNSSYFDKLVNDNKTVYVLDATSGDEEKLSAYLNYGVIQGIHKKYLPASRNPWFSMEQKKPAPILVSSACRNGMKFIRNLAQVKSLTTFHSVYVKEAFLQDVDLIFCYFLTPTAQSILRENRKELGNGLEKFQPGDLNSAYMLDLTLVTFEERKKIHELYDKLKLNNLSYDAIISDFENIFVSYLRK